MVSGIDRGDRECAIGLNRADQSLINQNRGSGSAALEGQRGQPRLRLQILRLQVEDEPGLFVLVNTDLLWRRILKAALGDLYNVVLQFEIRQAQLAGLSELPLQFSVEKNSCVVLTGNHNERAQVVTGLGGRLIGGWLIGDRMMIDRDFSGRGVGRNTQSRQRRRWFGSRGCGRGGGRRRDARS